MDHVNDPERFGYCSRCRSPVLSRVPCRYCVEIGGAVEEALENAAQHLQLRTDWYYVDGVRYCTRCRTRRCVRQGGELPCPCPSGERSGQR